MPIEDRNEIPSVDEGPSGSITIRCDAHLHAAHVEAGVLVLDDHDVEAELALLALGSSLPPCLVYLAVWRQSVVDAAFLLAWGDDVDDDGLRTAREDWEGNYWESWPLEPPAGRVLFGPRLQRALALASARRAADEADAGRFDSWHALQRATQTRARSAFVKSLSIVEAHPRPDALVPVRILIDTRSTGGSISGRLARLGSGVQLVLPFDWLWTVWDTNGGLLGDQFVLSADARGAAVVRWNRSGAPQAEHLPEIAGIPLE